MGFVYLATPYSKFAGGLEGAFKMASQAAAELIRAGIPVYCPIAHTHPIAVHGDLDPLDHRIWLPADTPFLVKAAALVIYEEKGWSESFGIAQEIKFFTERRKPIFRWKPPTLPDNLKVQLLRVRQLP